MGSLALAGEAVVAVEKGRHGWVQPAPAAMARERPEAAEGCDARLFDVEAAAEEARPPVAGEAVGAVEKGRHGRAVPCSWLRRRGSASVLRLPKWMT